MRSFMRLVQNEWLKLAKKRSFYIAYGIMAAVVIGAAILIKQFGGGELPATTDFVDLILAVDGLGGVFVMIATIFTAGIVSIEHQLGSVKMLLIRSHSRSTILASKYAAMLIYIVVMLIFTGVLASATGMVLFNGDSLPWSEVLQTAGYQLLYTVIYATLMFMFSVLTRSTGATIGVGLFLMMFEGIITMLLSRYDFAKYILFLNMNLSVYDSGSAPIEGMSMGFSSIVIAVYMLLFLAVSFVTFNKRDVA